LASNQRSGIANLNLPGRFAGCHSLRFHLLWYPLAFGTKLINLISASIEPPMLIQPLDRFLLPKPSGIVSSKQFSSSIATSFSPGTGIIRLKSRRTLVSTVREASMATRSSYGADQLEKKQKRSFAPLNPDAQNGRDRPRLKGIIFDVDGTLWYSALTSLCHFLDFI
jgi:hypothetical protein